MDYSTESHIAASWESLGHTVLQIQEGETKATDVVRHVDEFHADLYQHTQTYGLAVSSGTIEERRQMLDDIKSLGLPTIGYHLDLWRGLDRQDQLSVEPYFQVDHFFSTDGGDPKFWQDYGINHHYLPPGVYHAEAYDGTPRREFASDVAFVGSWRHYGHDEHWLVRKAMLAQLRRRYGRRFVMWPKLHAIRGTDLTDLYASVKVIVGDSCLAGKLPGYWSDRVPETMGRGGFLVHPYVDGILTQHPHLATFDSPEAMLARVDFYLDKHPDAREEWRKNQAAHTRQHHTYRRRIEQVLEVVYGDGSDGRSEAQQSLASEAAHPSGRTSRVDDSPVLGA